MSDIKAVEPTEKEAFFMMHVLKHAEGKPKVDWNKVAAAEGLKSGTVASVRFGQIKRRLGWKPNEAKSDGASNSKGSFVLSAASPSKVTKSKAKTVVTTPRTKRAIDALEQAVSVAAILDEAAVNELAAASKEMKDLQDGMLFN
ncbi:MAG: hypothetical protein M1830_000477 [Pleopsidium flavum]|nr:MAG: hypothetical protein M1830_000477 [Pleopsidium flavum]